MRVRIRSGTFGQIPTRLETKKRILVRDSTGKPIPAASVSLRVPGLPVFGSTTNLNGEAVVVFSVGSKRIFEEATIGFPATLSVRKPGFKDFSKEIILNMDTDFVVLQEIPELPDIPPERVPPKEERPPEDRNEEDVRKKDNDKKAAPAKPDNTIPILIGLGIAVIIGMSLFFDADR